MSETVIVNASTVISAVVTILMLIAVLRSHHRLVRGLSVILVVGALAVACVAFWYGHRPLPPERDELLFQGVEYVRDVRNTPRSLVIHVVRVDLDTPGLRFFVTPAAEDVPAQTVAQFLDTYDLQLAINADFFDPWWDRLPWDYYPHAGDPVNTRGFAASEGKVLTNGYEDQYDTLYISADNQVTFDTYTGKVYNAVSGNGFLVLDGATLIPQVGDKEYAESFHPRTAVGLDVDDNTLILLLVDGRQPGYSEGVTLDELAELMIEYGADHAINLDGGGSTTLVMEGDDGMPVVLNSPIRGRIPGQERPVANQLGIYAPR